MFKHITLKAMAKALHAQLIGQPQGEPTGVSKDSRSLQAGELYLALRGERFDGHQFLSAAKTQGAVAAIVETPQPELDLCQLQVADSQAALLALASLNRAAFNGPVVAITGSAGKTTTKELMAAVLAEQYRTLMTQGNLNNHIGAPLTLLELDDSYQAAVIELGASGVGEIAYTAAAVKPLVGIITNAAAAHIEGFGSLANVVQTKGELLDYIDAKGTAVLNRDDPHFAQWQARALARGITVLSFGLTQHADVQAQRVKLLSTGAEFELCYQGQRQHVQLQLLGEHNICNALAVSAAALALGLSLEQIALGLKHVAGVKGRLELVIGAQGQRILNDSYNANPSSVRAAIDVLKMSPHSWLVLGDMAELGAKAKQEHEQIGAYAKAQGIEHLLLQGKLAAHAATGFGSEARCFADKPSLLQFLQTQTTAADTILVKGSRSAGMETIVSGLQHEFKGL